MTKNKHKGQKMPKEENDHIEDLLEEEESGAEPSGLEIIQAKLKEAEEKLLRQAADTDNYLKRIKRETDDKIKYANQSLLEKFLPVLDNFDLTLQHGGSSSVDTLIEGVRLTRKVMIDTLAKVGLEKIEVNVGDTFDPVTQEAIMLTDEPDLPDNSVAMVVQNGYTLEGRIVRPAKVQVNKLS